MFDELSGHIGHLPFQGQIPVFVLLLSEFQDYVLSLVHRLDTSRLRSTLPFCWGQAGLLRMTRIPCPMSQSDSGVGVLTFDEPKGSPLSTRTAPSLPHFRKILINRFYLPNFLSHNILPERKGWRTDGFVQTGHFSGT